MSGTAQAEFRLVAACTNWPPSESCDRAIRNAAASDVDWDKVCRLARRHRVEAMVFSAMQRAGALPPPAIAAALKAAALRISGQNLVLASEAVRLQKLFDAARIAVLFLKGSSLSMLAYGSLALKHGKDIDLLVARADAERALALLEQQGYVARQLAGADTDRVREAMFSGPDIALARGGIEVELHWQPFENRHFVQGFGMSSPRQAVALHGAQTIDTLADAELFTYLSAHGAHHAWFRLKWLADLNAFLSSRDSSAIKSFYETARRGRAEVCAILALRLCQDLFGLETSAALTAKPSWRVRLLRAFAMDMMAAETEIYHRRFGTARLKSFAIPARTWVEVFCCSMRRGAYIKV